MRAGAAPSWVLVLLGGCTCGSTVVPDHRPPATPTPAELADPPPAQSGALEPAEHPEGTRSLALDGAPVPIPSGSVRASGLLDFDRDGDRDALLVVIDGANARVLHAERQNAESFAAPVDVASRALEPGCTWGRASLAALSAQWTLASAEASCEAGPSQLTSAWVIPTSARPRALEHVELVRGEGEGLAFRAADRDADGHDDLELAIRLASAGGEIEETLRWLSRAAGLAREGTEPAQSITALTTRGRERLRRAPADALAIAERALGLHDALCREADHPRLRIGGVAGVPCAEATGAGRARAVRAAALVRALGRAPIRDLAALDAALEATLDVEDRGAPLREADAGLLDAAWSGVATELAEVAIHRAGAVAPLDTGPAPRLSTLAFLDEDRLLVRGASPQVLRLGEPDGPPEPAPPEHAQARIRDVDGALELASIERTCEGIVVVVEPVLGIAGPLGRREILALPRAAPSSCPALPEPRRRETEGVVALGWAPQGLVLARGRRLVLVPLDAQGAPTGAASELAPEVPPPAPLSPGAALADLRAHALALRAGILVIDRGAPAVTLLRGPRFEPPSGRLIDVALSPSLARVAWLCGEAVCWADVGSSPGATTPAGG